MFPSFPTIVTGPLLIVLGFSSIAAATIALIADSKSVAFGAATTTAGKRNAKNLEMMQVSLNESFSRK
ncbi:L-lactate permease [Niallia endozanthoxylica]|uniref:L-lactate permease n=1 Tax=Niallia endozanthoxylica TaxID=2036016 RepID=A0A5J5HZ15_9BACI|nr:hypothetical protein F4V44_05440 [Niallia endozanthoxylica]